MDERLLNKGWRLSNLYAIINKDMNKIPFSANLAQAHFEENRHSRNIILKSRQLGFCLDPKTRVLTADLTWVKIADLLPGQEVVAVDEYFPGGRGKGRKMRTATIEVVKKVRRKAYKISFDDGRSVICSAQHPWLSRKIGTDTVWRAIEQTKYGKGVLKIGTKVRWITKPWGESSFEDGWFGGILDGEGSIAKNNVSAGINAAQRAGDVWDRMVKYAEGKYNFRIETDYRKAGTSSKLGNKIIHKICFGRMDEMFRLIGQTRPSRFLSSKFWEGRDLPGKKSAIGWSKITKIEEVGERVMIDLQTSSKTFIAEGFVSHNSTFEAIDSLDDCLFNKNFSALIINYERQEAIKLFNDKIKLAWDNLPDVIKSLYTVDTERRNELRFGFGDRSFSQIAVTASGRGGTANRVHITELAKLARRYPQKATEILTGTIPSVPSTGRVDIESTAEGSDGLFYDLFMEAYNRNRPPSAMEFKAHFYNWQWDKEDIQRTVLVAIPFSQMDNGPLFKDYQIKHDLTDLEITYYYLKWLSVNKDWQKMRQEYPTTVEEAFIGSGYKMFDQDALEKMKPGLREGTVHEDWIFYAPYIDGHVYCVGVDVGHGIELDSSTIVIIDVTGDKAAVVAEYCSNKVAPDLLAYEIVRGCSRYGNPIVGVERNDVGHTTLTILKGIYENVYTEVREDMVADTVTEKLGWHTNQYTKPKMMYALSDAIRDGLIYIPSKYLYEELRTYDKEDVQKINFDKTQSRHWDLVCAFAIAWQMKAFAYQQDDIEIYNT